MLTFIWHQLLGRFRGVFWQKNLVMTILTAMMYTYLVVMIVLLGFFADKLIAAILPGTDVVAFATISLFYYFLFDLIVRFLFQKTSGITVQHYALLPIPKSTLLHFPLIVSAMSLFNVVPIIVFTSFLFKEVIHSASWYFALSWWLVMLLMTYVNNYLNLSLRYTFRRKPVLVLLLLGLPLGLLIAEVAGLTAGAGTWQQLVYAIGYYPALLLVPFLLLVAAYFLGYRVMKAHYYDDGAGARSTKLAAEEKEGFWSFLHRFGTVGRMIEVEVKLIFRNTRPKVQFYMSAGMIAYLCFMVLGVGYSDLSVEELNDKNLQLLGFSIFTSSSIMLIYGQFLFAWESSYFDGVLAHNIASKDIITAKYWLLTGMCVLSSLIFLPAFFIYPLIVPYALSATIFNLGFSSFLLILTGTFNTSRIEANKSPFMNYQGTNLMQFLMVFLIICIPLGIYWPFVEAGLSDWGLIVLAGIGVLSLLLRNQIIKLFIRLLNLRKYKMARGFRKF